MANFEKRVENLEREREEWPDIVVWREHESDEEVEAVIAEQIRARGWAGAIKGYPGRVLVVSWEGDE